jgi:hypothetical protein
MKQTLDIHHTNQIAKIRSARQVYECTRDRIAEIDRQTALFSSSSASDAEFQRHMDMVDERLDLKKKLVEIGQLMDETSYLVKTSDILFKYYDLVENGQTNVLTADHNSFQSPNSILRFFVAAPPTPPIQQQQLQQQQQQTNPSFKSSNKSRGSLLDNYMAIMNDDYINPKIKDGDDNCKYCGSAAVVTMLNDGYYYCSCCNAMENMIVDHDKPSYKDPPKEITYFSYKRANHLNEWLNQIQGKETTEIPEEIYDKILLEIKKQRITNMADLTYAKVKRILKQLKVHKYYEHIPHIIHRLNGLPMPNFTPELEEKLRNMFKQIQTPFLKHSPPSRKNFLSYSYCLHKSLQLLEKDEFLKYFSLLRSREKLAGQDKIWKSICMDVGWEYIPSI